MEYQPGPGLEVEAKYKQEEIEKELARNQRTPRRHWSFLAYVADRFLSMAILVAVIVLLFAGVQFLFSLFS